MDPRAATIFDGQGGVASTLALMAAGVSADELHRMVRKKEIVRLRRDTLVRATELQDVTPWERRAVVTRAVGQSMASAIGADVGQDGRGRRSGGYALSHHSALIAHGLPYFGEDDLVHLCRTDGGRGRRDSTVFVHKAVDPTWVEEVDGLRVVTPVLAALQVAAHAGVEAGLVCLDGVLHQAETTDQGEGGRRDGPARAAVQTHIDRALEQGFPRADAVVREVAEMADGGSDSAGESRTRWMLHLLGLGPLITQFQVRDGRVLLGIADLKLKDHMVLIEFDGQGKYADGSSLYAEKRREDQIRRLGYEMVRITWDDLDHPARVRQRVLAAIARAAQRQVMGA